jgi:hypothetical protein
MQGRCCGGGGPAAGACAAACSTAHRAPPRPRARHPPAPPRRHQPAQPLQPGGQQQQQQRGRGRAPEGAAPDLVRHQDGHRPRRLLAQAGRRPDSTRQRQHPADHARPSVALGRHAPCAATGWAARALQPAPRALRCAPAAGPARPLRPRAPRPPLTPHRAPPCPPPAAACPADAAALQAQLGYAFFAPVANATPVTTSPADIMATVNGLGTTLATAVIGSFSASISSAEQVDANTGARGGRRGSRRRRACERVWWCRMS